MNLPTIVVCDDNGEKKAEIEALISSQPSLILLGTVSRQTALSQQFQQGIKILWLELAPDPQKGLALLGTLKEKYPKMHYLVSYETLQADLVKTAMQLGAIEYLDMAGAANLLPGAVNRISAKESTATETAKPAPQAPLAAAKPSATYENLQPANQGSIAQGRAAGGLAAAADHSPTREVSHNLKRTRSLNTEGDPNSMLPPWVLPAVMLVMIIVAVVVMFMRH